MAKVDIQYNCGCSFLTHNLAAAEAHCDSAFHDMSVNGIIKSTTRTSVHQATPRGYKGAGKVDHHGDRLYGGSMPAVNEPKPELKKQEIQAEFGSLRDKLRRKA